MPDDQLGELLKQGDFDGLFRTRMGWDNPKQRVPVLVDDSSLRPVAVADKRGVTAWRVDSPEGLPKSSEQHRVVRTLKRLSRDQLVVFVSSDTHQWLWPELRSSGVGYRLVRHEYPVERPTESLLQRLGKATFKLAEESTLTSSEVLTRVRHSFNADKVTKSFYREFQTHHKKFASEVEGIPDGHSRRWYASVLLNRMMFIYFIQQKSFLDRDSDYLRNRLQVVRGYYGANQFYAFFKEFLLPLFHQGLGSNEPEYADPEIERIVGSVPYVNGGIFEPHRLETAYDVQIKDRAFESLFDFFDKWRWHLDENPTGAHNEINPDILGFIFEQYINFTEAGQKESGAYYTKPDVTGYMAASAILPALADRFASTPELDDPCILLKGSGDTYIHDSILHGVDLTLPEERDADSPPPFDELALPGERWCDVTHRRDRCRRLRELLSDQSREWSIEDSITENLDMRELLADYLIQLSTSEECDAAFNVLKSLTVCDPTVGSGAFLFAALEVLDPLYEAVVERAAELSERNGSSPPAECLLEADVHHSKRYWMLKTLCLKNLYGVDLMEEAPEIAKLRLFLKLAAQIDDVSHIEPLPDLDFNIKSGNLLVGIADDQDAETRLGSGRLDLGGEIAAIKAVADRVAADYDAFTEIQSRDLGAGDLTQSKGQLAERLEEARGLADTLLHGLRAESPTRSFEDWRDSHQPFHWFVEFPSVWRSGGFDVILGNPPYIKARSVGGYRWKGYKARDCPDMYAICLERASSLLNERGRISMIVMHSLCFSKNFRVLRSHLEQHFKTIWVSSYSRIPDGLFSGSARVRNSILIGSLNGPDRLFTSQCRRWLTIARPTMFANVEYIEPEDTLFTSQRYDVWPFLDSPKLSQAFAHMVTQGKQLKSALRPHGPFRLAFKVTAQYMLGISPTPPPTRGTASTQRYGYLHFDDKRQRDLALLMLVGRWGYLWWMTFSDEFDVTKGTLASFPGDVQRLSRMVEGPPSTTSIDQESELVGALVELSHSLQEEMPKHLAWKLNAGVEVGRYNLAAPPLRRITDEADLLLAKVWGVEEAYEGAGNLRDRMVFGNRG